jgi:putative transcriptional regulator
MVIRECFLTIGPPPVHLRCRILMSRAQRERSRWKDDIAMTRRTLPQSLLLAVLLFLGWHAVAHAADLSRAAILVAKPELRDQLYGSTILVVVPVGGDRHVGFIVNRPTPVTLGNAFPEDGPAQKVVDPVYIGGPYEAQAIFALVKRPDSPGGVSLELMPGLFAAFDVDTVDRIIRSEPEHARFVAGLVAWSEGELRDEVERGAWYVLEPDPEVALRKPTEGLWEELLRRSQTSANAI